MVDNKIYVTKSSLLGQIANWATQLSPYNNPENLALVLEEMKSRLAVILKLTDNTFMLEFNDKPELYDFLDNNLLSIPEVEKWNEPKNSSAGENIFVTAFSKDPDPDDDFIDLGALVRNIVNSLVKENDEFLKTL